jgi:hypothetical protein
MAIFSAPVVFDDQRVNTCAQVSNVPDWRQLQNRSQRRRALGQGQVSRPRTGQDPNVCSAVNNAEMSAHSVGVIQPARRDRVQLPEPSQNSVVE